MLSGACRKRRCVYILWFAVIGIAVAGSPRTLSAQDAFEIRVEGIEEPALGEFTYEEHLNAVGIGTKDFDGTVAPTNHQFHMSSELTAGITNHFSLGFMLLTAAVPGRSGLEYAGWRVLPHVYVPSNRHLPVKIGLTAEFGFHPALFEASAHTLELRPIVEKQIGRIQFDVNPSIERSLSGSSGEEGWRFEPSARFAFDVNSRFGLALEYFGATGSLTRALPLKQQVHQVYPTAILKLGRGVLWDFGIGAGLTPAGNRLVFKTRIEISFGRKH
jgi:hypothetical protein